ncbi:MAG TPA: hypothetical protein DDZ81_16400 [Acetobacteraceae bacterium]|nr:hypothetical protein [Acetobacteraceae bacterium]
MRYPMKSPPRSIAGLGGYEKYTLGDTQQLPRVATFRHIALPPRWMRHLQPVPPTRQVLGDGYGAHSIHPARG